MINSDNFKSKRVLFILKKRSSYGVSYGLTNSCKFISNTLSNSHIQSKVVEVDDNNCIDKEVYNYKPTHVFIEALWVVPDKFNVLLSKYPSIKWSVRIHSKIPFIAMEGIAMQWLKEYQENISCKYNNFTIGANSETTVNQLCELGINTRYFPNIYNPKLNRIISYNSYQFYCLL